MTTDPKYMHRCIELARLGTGYVAPNPMVGAVLVHNDVIIGEGWHQQYGEAHAEVNCINDAIRKGHADKVSRSVLYVSLEPCAHFGKTPPCADLIISHKIPKVVIGCRDPFKEVDGKGIEKLKQAAVEVELGVLEQECKELNKRFFTFHTQHRPWVLLKWAETSDGFIASPHPSGGGALKSSNNKKLFQDSDSESHPRRGEGSLARLLISNEYSNRLVHQWRSEEASILVGTNTALLDDPELTTRSWPGNSPIRLVIDMDLKLPASLNLFDRKHQTIVFNTIKHEEQENLLYYQVTNDVSVVHQLLNALYQLKIQSVMVEGGAKLLQSFIDEKAWDEMRVIRNKELEIRNGIKGPVMADVVETGEQQIGNDVISYYKPT